MSLILSKNVIENHCSSINNNSEEGNSQTIYLSNENTLLSTTTINE